MRFPRLTILAFAPALLTSCNEGSTFSPDAGDTRLTVFLTDAPGDVEAVWVEILEMYVKGDGERIDLLDSPTGLIELTDLAGSGLELVDGVTLPAGRYGEFRLVIGGAVLETMDGDVFSKDGTEHPGGLPTTGELKCPSCSQSGLKVKLAGGGIDLEEGGHVVIADFDVNQSFGKERGNSGKWVMHPTIHGSTLASGGSIEGTVSLAAEVTLPECPAGTTHDLGVFVPMGAARTLTDEEGHPIVRTGHSEPDGHFAIEFLTPDTYDLSHEPEIEVGDHVLSLTATVAPAEATVAPGSPVTGVEYSITGASCAAQS